jgi:outer membrane biosynthesis protein TonB
MTMQDGIRAVQTAFSGPTPPRWPMYVRQAKQFLRGAIQGFDEKNYGFASVVDLLRAAGKEGVLRIERDRQGAIRAFAGPKLTTPSAAPVGAEPVAELPIVDAEPVVEPPIEAPIVETASVEPPTPPRRRKAAKPKAEAAGTRSKRPARARKTVRTKDAAADRSE